MIIVYLLPVYRLTSHLTQERASKVKNMLLSTGVSETDYWMTWLLYYIVGVTLVSLAQAILLTYGVFKYSSLGMVFAVIWLYGLSLFGYAVFTQAFFSKATFSSFLGCLFFFATSFIDQVVADPFMAEHFKLLASVLPSVAI